MTSRAFGAPRRLTFHSWRSAIDSRSGAALALAVLALWIIAVVDSSPSGGSDDPNTVPDVYRGISDRDQTRIRGQPARAGLGALRWQRNILNCRRAPQDGQESWWAVGYKARWMRSASSSSAMAAAGSLPICFPMRSTATDRTCSACALESCLSPV